MSRKIMIINKAKICTTLDDLDFWYELTDGGYLNPDELLDEHSAKQVKEAISVLQGFESELMAALEDMEDEAP